jgi:hypothetical protein
MLLHSVEAFAQILWTNWVSRNFVDRSSNVSKRAVRELCCSENGAHNPDATDRLQPEWLLHESIALTRHESHFPIDHLLARRFLKDKASSDSQYHPSFPPLQ